MDSSHHSYSNLIPGICGRAQYWAYSLSVEPSSSSSLSYSKKSFLDGFVVIIEGGDGVDKAGLYDLS